MDVVYAVGNLFLAWLQHKQQTPMAMAADSRRLSRELSRESKGDMDVNMSATPSRVILLACGSFNPITNMHLRMFELARDFLHRTGKYRVVGGIISPVNDKYGKKGLVSSKHRNAMIKMALKTSDWIRLDTWECEQDVWLPTAKTLRHHRETLDSQHNANIDTPSKKRKLDHDTSAANLSTDDSEYSAPPSNLNWNSSLADTSAPVQLKLLCGADLLESFGVPDLWAEEDMEAIVRDYGIVCISRSGTSPEKFIYESDILAKHQNNINLVTEWISNEISATRIRRALRRGESVKYLLQDSVIDYIKAHNLYGAADK